MQAQRLSRTKVVRFFKFTIIPLNVRKSTFESAQNHISCNDMMEVLSTHEWLKIRHCLEMAVTLIPKEPGHMT